MLEAMPQEPAFYAVAVPAVLFAGVSKGGFGSGAAFAATPLVALVAGPGEALGIMLPLLMAMDLTTLGPYRGQWSGPDARLLILGGLPGILLGAAVWRIAPEDAIRALIGTIALAFVAWQLVGRRALVPRVFPPQVGILTGVAAGFTSFVSHAGGPPVAIYLIGRGLGKTAYQATTVLTFWAINLAKAVPYALLGIFTARTLSADLVLAPAAVAGALIGVRAHRFVPERLFFGLAYALLTGAGLKLLWDALT